MELEFSSFVDSNGDGFADLDAADHDGDGILDPYAFNNSFNGGAELSAEDADLDGVVDSEQTAMLAGYKKP